MTLKKILQDCVALYKAHFLYITTLIGAVIIPYTLIIRMETLPDIFIMIVPIFVLLLMLVEIVSTRLVSTGYIEKEFLIVEELKAGLKLILPYTFITFITVLASFFGLSLFILPGLIAGIFFNILKVDYIIHGGKIRERFVSSVKLLNNGSFIKIVKIYILPTLLQFALAFIISPYLHPETLEQDIYKIYPYMTVGLIIIFPVSICFRTAIYFNNVKERHSKPTDQLV